MHTATAGQARRATALVLGLLVLYAFGCEHYQVAAPTNTPPLPPRQPQPVADTTGVVGSLLPELSWQGGGDADRDAVVFDVYAGLAAPLTYLATTAEPNYQLIPPQRLTGESVVYWQVVARDALGDSAQGPTWYFRTPEDLNAPPTSLSNPVPADGASGVARNQLLQWFGGIDPEGGPVTYAVALDTSLAFESSVLQAVSGLVEQRFAPPESLVAHATYYWQVTAQDSVLAETQSAVWSFATGSGSIDNRPPSQVGAPSPSSGASGVPIAPTVLTWEGGIDPDGDPVVYNVYFGSAGGALLLLGSTSSREWTLAAPLEFETSYAWRVESRDDQGHVTIGPTWLFVTEANDPPSTPNNPSPEHLAEGQPTDVVLSWEGGEDPEGLGVTYRVFLAPAGTPLQLLATTTDRSVSAALNGALDYSRSYRWKVEAIDSAGLTTPGGTWRFKTGQSQAPAAPCPPLEPADGANQTPLAMLLTWSCGDDPDGDPVTYEVRLDRNSPPAETIAESLTDRSLFIRGLEPHTTYYWQVRATDGLVEPSVGPVWRFRTRNQPPGQVSDPEPQHAAVGVDINADLRWQAATDQDGDPVIYRVELGPTQPPEYAGSTANTQFDPGTLQEGTTYYWRIVAEDAFGGSTPGPTWRFQTGIVPNLPPSAPSNPVPQDGQGGVDPGVTLAWSPSIDPDGDAIVYDVHLGVTNPPGFMVSQSASTFDPPGDLSYDTTYFWQIIADDSEGARVDGPVWWFKTGPEPNAPPEAPASPNVQDGAVGVAVDVALSWAASSDPNGDPVSYDVYFGVEDEPPLVASSLVSPNYDPPGDLGYSTTYNWRVVAADDQGGATSGPYWSFTTAPEPNTPPSQPLPVSPANGATDQPVQPTLSWVASSDPDGDPVVYDVYLGTALPPPLLTTVTATSLAVGPLDYATTYWWQVRARDDRGGESPGTLRSFRTVANQPPTLPASPNPADGAIAVPVSATMSWAPSIDPEGDPVTYDVYFGFTSPPPQVSAGQSPATYTPNFLFPGSTYYWRIEAADGAGNQVTSAEWSFTTAP